MSKSILNLVYYFRQFGRFNIDSNMDFILQQALVVSRLPTIEPIPSSPTTTSIIKEEVDLEDDDVRDSPELSRDGDQVEFEVL